MSLVLQTSETVNASIERQLVAAQREADEYAAQWIVAEYGAQWAAEYGGTDEDAFRAEADFDFLDVKSGELLHDPDCPYCRLRKLKRAYDRITLKGSPHDKAPH